MGIMNRGCIGINVRFVFLNLELVDAWECLSVKYFGICNRVDAGECIDVWWDCI
jgi:hypothetical protein